MGDPSKILGGVGAVMYGAATYNLVDGGLAKTLGLETLTHGTNIINNLRIRALGGLPSEGGAAMGSINDENSHFHARAIGYFFLFKDLEFQTDPEFGGKSKCDFISSSFVDRVRKNIVHRTHAYLSSYNMGSAYFSKFTNKEMFCRACGVVGIFVSPTLRFRFSDISRERFENDSHYSGFAYKTSQIVEPWRIGPIGSCLTGFNSNWISRVQDNPVRALTGVAQLIAACAIIKFKGALMRAKIPLFALGALLA